MQMMLHFAGINVNLIWNIGLPQLHVSPQLNNDHTLLFQKKISTHFHAYKVK